MAVDVFFAVIIDVWCALSMLDSSDFNRPVIRKRRWQKLPFHHNHIFLNEILSDGPSLVIGVLAPFGHDFRLCALISFDYFYLAFDVFWDTYVFGQVLVILNNDFIFVRILVLFLISIKYWLLGFYYALSQN